MYSMWFRCNTDTDHITTVFTLLKVFIFKGLDRSAIYA